MIMTHHNVVPFSNPEPGEAGPVITLKIGGNRLVGLLNSLDFYAFHLKRRKFVGDDLEFVDDWDRKLWDLTESIRDEISAQRNNTTTDDVRKSVFRDWTHIDA
jgi:hypothetical protein